MDADTTNMNIFELLDRKNLYLIKLDIFSRLDYRSLHTARQVCREWNQFVLDEFWFSNNRRRMRRLMAFPDPSSLIHIHIDTSYFIGIDR